MTNQEAIEILKDLWRWEHPNWLEKDIRKALDKGIEALENQKIGHWIEHKIKTIQWVECSECHITYKYKTHYCPNCGAKMEGENNGNS